MNLGERLASLETSVKIGFGHINELLENHLQTHSKRERFHERIIVTLIGITGSAIVALLILILRR